MYSTLLLLTLVAMTVITMIALRKQIRSGFLGVMIITTAVTTLALAIPGRRMEVELMWEMRSDPYVPDPFGFFQLLVVGAMLAFGLLMTLALREGDPEID